MTISEEIERIQDAKASLSDKGIELGLTEEGDNITRIAEGFQKAIGGVTEERVIEIVDEKISEIPSGESGGGSPYDLVIRTQEEFDVITVPTFDWSGIKSVAIVNNGTPYRATPGGAPLFTILENPVHFYAIGRPVIEMSGSIYTIVLYTGVGGYVTVRGFIFNTVDSGLIIATTINVKFVDCGGTLGSYGVAVFRQCSLIDCVFEFPGRPGGTVVYPPIESCSDLSGTYTGTYTSLAVPIIYRSQLLHEMTIIGNGIVPYDSCAFLTNVRAGGGGIPGGVNTYIDSETVRFI